jgi:hypothetical protein
MPGAPSAVPSAGISSSLEPNSGYGKRLVF